MKRGENNGVEWKDIEGYEGQYQVSNYGDIKRLERDIVDSLGRKKHYSEKIFHPHKANNGYTRVSFGTDRDLTHRVVAKAFLPNPNNLPEVNHKNGLEKDNNFVGTKENNYTDGNLEWVTRKENMYHASVTGLINRHSEKRKEAIKINRKIALENHCRPVAMILEGKLISIFRSLKDASDITKIPQQNIGENCRGNRSSAGGYNWKYVDKNIYNTITQEIV